MDQEDRIKERVSDLIIDLIHRCNLSNVKLSEILGCNRNTVNNHRLQAHLPRLNFITKLATHFNVNLNWVYFGEGEMYHGDEPKLLTSPRQDPGRLPDPIEPSLPELAAEPPLPPEEDYGSPENMKIQEALDKAAKILKSNTSRATYLFSNIEHLDDLVTAEKENESITRSLEALQREVSALSKRLTELTIGPREKKQKAPGKKRRTRKTKKRS